MAGSNFEVLEQAAWVVIHAAHRGVAIWTAHQISGKRRTQLIVLAPERTLLPRDSIAHGVKAHANGIERADVEAWLVAHGYARQPQAAS